jgi:F0F1-type ATP synthase delta subunit
MQEESIAGRYAATLFIAASKENNLFNVYEDLQFLRELYDKMESLRIFADNAGLSSQQVNLFVDDLAKQGEFCQTTVKFCGKKPIIKYKTYLERTRDLCLSTRLPRNTLEPM